MPTSLKAFRSPTTPAVARGHRRRTRTDRTTQRELAPRLKRPHSVVGMIKSNQRQVRMPEFIVIAEGTAAAPGRPFGHVLRERGRPMRATGARWHNVAFEGGEDPAQVLECRFNWWAV